MGIEVFAMTLKYVHWISTGSGSNNVALHFHEGDSAEILVNTNWMGAGKHDAIFVCQHLPQSPTYGVLQVKTIKEDDIEIDFSALDTIPIYEYIKTPESKDYLHKDDALTLMRSQGYATWNETFDLVLMLNAFVDTAIASIEDEKLSTLFRRLDKLKFKQELESS
jgi:hypothetical protein